MGALCSTLGQEKAMQFLEALKANGCYHIMQRGKVIASGTKDEIGRFL
jgi:hypothetical protein